MDDQKKNSEIHEYDGIQEQDNEMPRWWINALYVTVGCALLYLLYYSFGSGPTQLTEYKREKAYWELVEHANQQVQKPLTDEELTPLLADVQRVQNGSQTYQNRCASCHGTKGEGNIGPSLAARFWKYQGKPAAIVKAISQGVPEKGMPAWGPLLKPDEIHNLVAYIKSIAGHQNPNPQ